MTDLMLQIRWQMKCLENNQTEKNLTPSQSSVTQTTLALTKNIWNIKSGLLTTMQAQGIQSQRDWLLMLINQKKVEKGVDQCL